MSILAYALEPYLGRLARFAVPIAWLLTIGAMSALWLVFGWLF